MAATGIGAVNIGTYIGAFNNVYEGSISGIWYPDVANVYPLTTLVGVYPGLATVAGMKAWTGSRQGNKPLPFKITVVSAPYEDSVIYPVDNYKADPIGIFQTNVENMAEKAKYHFNWMVRDLLLAGHTLESFDSRFDLGPDNDVNPDPTIIHFFATDHPTRFDATGANPAGTQSNLFTYTSIPSLAVVNKLAPTAGEMAQIINDLTGAFLGMTDLAGDPINGGARKFRILVGNQNKFSAVTTALASINLVGAITSNSGAVITNPIAGLKSKGFEYECVFEPAMTGDAIFMLRADGRVKPVVIQEFNGIEFQPLGPESEYAKINNNVLFGVKAVRAVAPWLYTSAIKATLSNHAGS